MSTSQHSQLSIVPGIGRREEPEPSDGRYEPTIGLKAVAKILDCSAEQCRRLAEAKKIPVFRIGYRWKSTASAIVRWREEQLALTRHSRQGQDFHLLLSDRIQYAIGHAMILGYEISN